MSIETRNQKPVTGGQVEFFTKLLQEQTVDLLLVPQESPSKKTVVQTLVKGPSGLKTPNPSAPVLMGNSASLVSDLTFRNMGKKIGVVLRPCEIRAVIELAKLKQLSLEDLYIIGVDCLGTYEYKDFVKLLEKENDIASLTGKFIKGELQSGDIQIRDACRICIYPVPENAAYRLQLVEDTSALMEKRKKQWEKILGDFNQRIASISGLINELSGCRRCYNCRRACPICYCRECIFDSVTFEHSPEQYLRWMNRKEILKMPTDTLLFHLTRLNHMVTSCIACGQCSSACPNDIAVGKIFSAIGNKVQELFKYIPGRNVDEELPLATFKEEELQQ